MHEWGKKERDWLQCPFQGSCPMAPFPDTIRIKKEAGQSTGYARPGKNRWAVSILSSLQASFPFPAPARRPGSPLPAVPSVRTTLHEDSQPLQIHPLFQQQQQTPKPLLPASGKEPRTGALTRRHPRGLVGNADSQAPPRPAEPGCAPEHDPRGFV